jgi:hypothetical protein
MRSQLNKAPTRLKLALGGGYLLHLLTAAFGTKQTTVDVRSHVRYRGQSGRYLLAASISGFDPKRTLAAHPTDL